MPKFLSSGASIQNLNVKPAHLPHPFSKPLFAICLCGSVQLRNRRHVYLEGDLRKLRNPSLPPLLFFTLSVINQSAICIKHRLLPLDFLWVMSLAKINGHFTFSQLIGFFLMINTALFFWFVVHTLRTICISFLPLRRPTPILLSGTTLFPFLRVFFG